MRWLCLNCAVLLLAVHRVQAFTSVLPQQIRWQSSRSTAVRWQQQQQQQQQRVSMSIQAQQQQQQQPPCKKKTTRDLLSLDSIRGSLVRQEETIIFALIERAAFRHNPSIYTEKTMRLHQLGSDSVFDRDATFMEYMLCETEKVHARVRRYMSPEEQPFFPGFLPSPLLPALDFPQILAPNDVNINERLLRRYECEIVPAICEPGDDEQHGSSVLCDINALQALSRRVHFGKFVAESKFQESGDLYRSLCKAGNARGVNELLTNKAVELKVIERAYTKASTYAQEITSEGAVSGDDSNFKVKPAAISAIYRDFIIPLTKDVEIQYLFQRTGYPCPDLSRVHDDEHHDNLLNDHHENASRSSNSSGTTNGTNGDAQQ
jgi:chorismate mutase